MEFTPPLVCFISYLKGFWQPFSSCRPEQTGPSPAWIKWLWQDISGGVGWEWLFLHPHQVHTVGSCACSISPSPLLPGCGASAPSSWRGVCWGKAAGSCFPHWSCSSQPSPSTAPLCLEATFAPQHLGSSGEGEAGRSGDSKGTAPKSSLARRCAHATALR